MKDNAHYVFKSVSELHALFHLKKPTHPLVSVVKLEDITSEGPDEVHSIVYNFYTVFLKKNYDGTVKYGQQYYEFSDGMMTFYAPKQLITVEQAATSKTEGWMLMFHPDFFQGYPLAARMKEYGFFGYAANEARHLSEGEEGVISGIMQNLQREIESLIDGYTQDLVISHLDLLLNYCNRFYNRQFITRKKVSSDLLVRFEDLLSSYFDDSNKDLELPTVQFFADKLFVSPNYLNDVLKSLTGQTTQQHIHNHIVEKAKELLSVTRLSVGEIAYQLGFEYPQSFNKFFKNKTAVTPLEFRQSFN